MIQRTAVQQGVQLYATERSACGEGYIELIWCSEQLAAHKKAQPSSSAQRTVHA